MNLLNELIKNTGLNQSQFAKKVGVEPSHLNRSLKNGGDMKFSTFKKYCEIFGVKILEIKHGNCTVIIKF